MIQDSDLNLEEAVIFDNGTEQPKLKKHHYI